VALRVGVEKRLLLHDAFSPFSFFSDHCAILDLGYLKSGNRSSGAGKVPDIPDKRSSIVYPNVNIYYSHWLITQFDILQ
jgi:hypothetical protein